MILLLLQTLPAARAEPNLIFTHAFVAAAPPGVSAMAAYMSIENPGSSERRITGIGSPDFAEVQMHRSSIENGVARMQQLEALTVGPGSRLELKPGGVHLMLMDPRRDFEPGEIVLLELKEADGTEHSLALKVRRVTSAPDAHHH
jgi:periplasmic copper chaperone A